MATWPSGSKASTDNLDSGNDQPSLARADIKNNVDNVNSIIDSFAISTHSDGDILVWDSSNGRFTVTSPVDLVGITSIVAGTGISVDQTSDGGVIITNTVVDTDTGITSVIAGTGISVEQTSAGGVIITNTVVDTDTGITSVVAGTGITVDQTSEGGVTVASTITQYTDTLARQAISVTDTGGDGSLAYDNSSGVLTYTGPSATEVRAHFSAGTDISITDGVIAYTGTQLTVSAGTNIDVTEDSAGGVTVNLEPVVDGVEFRDYKETVYELSYAATITPDVANGNVQEITLTGNVAFAGFSSPETGQSLTLLLHQDGTGSRLFSEGLSSASLMLFAGGDSTLTTDANATDIMTIVYIDGIYYASLAKDFS